MWIEQSQQQVRDGRLPAAARPDNGEHLARPGAERHLLECGPAATDAEVHLAARQAALEPFIDSLPQGYDLSLIHI